MNRIIERVTQDIKLRSLKTREAYLTKMQNAKINKSANRSCLSCSNLAHVIAAMNEENKEKIIKNESLNIGIITAYNDMLSAHEPFYNFPTLIKEELKKVGASAQVASGVPAMCDGITQGTQGMELSLFSRDTIALSASIGLSHNVFDCVIYLGVCDKIVPGLFISAMSFGNLPSIFMPAGPMNSGISNKEKAHARQEYAQGNISKTELLKVESASYHSSGTCTFYGTANSNQMLLEMMGLQLPNSSFVNANTPLRNALSKKACEQLLKTKPIYQIIDERSFVNAIVGLMATGGSTNHTIHLIAMAKSAGIILTWDDFDAISSVTPLLCKLYPNGQADINAFRETGGMGVVIKLLIKAGLVFENVETIVGKGLNNYVVEPILKDGVVEFSKENITSKDTNIISSLESPFDTEGGLKLLNGNIGRSVIKTSALNAENSYIKAPAIVFNSQEELQEDFKKGLLEKDLIAVVRYQGPKANGMPELHGLMTPLGVLQDKGFKVAIITDGRMSGASGKVPSAIHMSPEALSDGVIAKIQTGDMIKFDIKNKTLSLLVTPNELSKRAPQNIDLSKNQQGLGRELFSPFRNNISSAEEGASIFNL